VISHPGGTGTRIHVFKNTIARTILIVMPIIPKPPGRGPLFGGKSAVWLLPNRGRDMEAVIRAARERAARRDENIKRGTPPGDDDGKDS
jgi:hypothetical protein